MKNKPNHKEISLIKCWILNQIDHNFNWMNAQCIYIIQKISTKKIRPNIPIWKKTHFFENITYSTHNIQYLICKMKYLLSRVLNRASYRALYCCVVCLWSRNLVCVTLSSQEVLSLSERLTKLPTRLPDGGPGLYPKGSWAEYRQ